MQGFDQLSTQSLSEMCGRDTSTAVRVGARVDLFSKGTHGPVGILLFLDPAAPESTTATHVRFTSSAGHCLRATSPVLVSIQYEC